MRCIVLFCTCFCRVMLGRKEGSPPYLLQYVHRPLWLLSYVPWGEWGRFCHPKAFKVDICILSWTWVVCIPGKLLIINCTRRRYTGASCIVCVGGCVFGGEEQGRETRNAINLAVKPRRRNNTLWEIHYYYSWKVDGAGLAWVPCCCCATRKCISMAIQDRHLIDLDGVELGLHAYFKITH